MVPALGVRGEGKRNAVPGRREERVIVLRIDGQDLSKQIIATRVWMRWASGAWRFRRRDDWRGAKTFRDAIAEAASSIKTALASKRC